MTVSTDCIDVNDPVVTGQTLDFDSSINPDLSPEDKESVRALLTRYSECFATSNSDLGHSNIVKHQIHTNNNQPIHQAPYPSAFKERHLI